MITRREMLAAIAAASVAGVVRGQASQPTMLTRKIPRDGRSIPAIGMGTWQTFDVDPRDANAIAPLTEVLKNFHAAGGRVIDSSPMYGRSEEVTGTLSTDLHVNADLFVATKVWTRGLDAGRAQMNESFRKLRRDTIDLMQVHNLVDVDTHLPELREMKDAGRIKYLGVTHYQPNAFADLERLMKTERLDFVQLPYSLDFRDATKRLLPTAADTGTAVLVMRPFGGGELFTKVRGKPLPDSAKRYATSWGEAFLKYILADARITAVLPATSKPGHLKDNLAAGFGGLPNDHEREELEVFIR